MCFVVQGEFIQTYRISGYWYGLTMAAVEQVAQQGLACVTHMSIEVSERKREILVDNNDHIIL